MTADGAAANEIGEGATRKFASPSATLQEIRILWATGSFAPRHRGALCAVAVTVICCRAVTLAGAEYKPAALRVPTAGLMAPLMVGLGLAERMQPAAGRVTLQFTLPRQSVSLIQLNW